MKHFTPDEANEALGTVRPLVERMLASRRELGLHQEELGVVKLAVAGNGGGLDPGRVETLEDAVSQATAALSRCVEEIQALGAQVKDVDRGLVDFPARHPANGETVLLCWHLGEDAVGYWHGLEEGFAGRKPLPF